MHPVSLGHIVRVYLGGPIKFSSPSFLTLLLWFSFLASGIDHIFLGKMLLSFVLRHILMTVSQILLVRFLVCRISDLKRINKYNLKK